MGFPPLNTFFQRQEQFQQAFFCAHDTWSRPLDTVQIAAMPSLTGITFSHAVKAASVVSISLPLWNALPLNYMSVGFSFRSYSRAKLHSKNFCEALKPHCLSSSLQKKHVIIAQ
jgi:hypothetical protein